MRLLVALLCAYFVIGISARTLLDSDSSGTSELSDSSGEGSNEIHKRHAEHSGSKSGEKDGKKPKGSSKESSKESNGKGSGNESKEPESKESESKEPDSEECSDEESTGGIIIKRSAEASKSSGESKEGETGLSGITSIPQLISNIASGAISIPFEPIREFLNWPTWHRLLKGDDVLGEIVERMPIVGPIAHFVQEIMKIPTTIITFVFTFLASVYNGLTTLPRNMIKGVLHHMIL